MKSNGEKRQANAEYWRQRAEKTKDISMQKADKFIAHMEREYKAASRNIELEVTDFLSRFAENEQMTLSNARKKLNAHELKEFRMELEEYIRKGKENGISADWTKQLESASLLHRIDRLQALKMQIDNQIEALAAYKEQGLNKTLGEIFEENYYRNIFDVQQMMGEGTAFAILDGRRIMQAISKPWRYDGKTFSDSIWDNKEKLKYSLERTLTQGIIRGSAPRKIAEAIAKETGRELYAAKRLVLTESAKMAEKASEEGYRELGVKEIEIVVALDERTCEVCGEMDGKHFPLDKAEGLTPPFHPNCRCTTVPYFNDEFTRGEERAAKDEDGKTYYVPADMTYKEWREKYVDKVKLNNGNISAKINKKANILTQNEVIEKAKRFAESEEYSAVRNFKELRAFVNKQLGYDELPTVVSHDEFERLSNEKSVLYRGLKPSGEKTAEDIANEFKYGTLWTGNSGGAVYGNGVYFTKNKSQATSNYMGNNGALIRAILKENAKVIDFKEIQIEYEKAKIPRRIEKLKEQYQCILFDVGQYAALKGYDAIATNGFNGHDYVIVLNRKAIFVEE